MQCMYCCMGWQWIWCKLQSFQVHVHLKCCNLLSTFQILMHKLTCLMFCWPCIVIYQYNKTNKMHCLLLVYLPYIQQLVHFVRIMLSGSSEGLTTLAASRHNLHKISQLLYIQYLQMMSKKVLERVEAINFRNFSNILLIFLGIRTNKMHTFFPLMILFNYIVFRKTCTCSFMVFFHAEIIILKGYVICLSIKY
jgi:hypothetical protein